MPAQTRSGMPPVLEDSTMAAIREALLVQFSRLAKVEFLKFSGENVRGWMFRCEEFFAIEQTADEGKISLISIHLYDIALMRHRQYVRFMGNTLTWPMYRDAILKRFGLAYDDPLAEIKNLKQTGSVQQYIDAYDRLLCRVELQDEQAMSFFIAGLQSEIKLVVRMFKPTSLTEFGQVFLLEVVVDEEPSGSQEIEECLEEEIVWEKEPRNEEIVNP
ncbi:gypsy/ty3 retroelement polyprotein [Tanacetum coccineum]